jgi:pseudouridine kinase
MTDEAIIPNPEAPVLVIGAASVDIVGRLRGELNLGTSNPAQIRSSFGGVARNVAENLARLGQPVILLTAIGDDAAGERLARQTMEAGVDMSATLRVPHTPTNTYLAIVNVKGKLQVALDDMRTTNAISPEYLEQKADCFRNASLVFLDANLSREALSKAISLARRAKVPICADPTSAVLAKRIKPHLSKLYLVTPNHSEASVLCERVVDPSRSDDALDSAKCLVSQGVRIAIVTLAEFGVCYATSQTSGFVPSIRTEVVDPSGGGDAMRAAVLFALLNNIPLDDAVRLGVSAATLTLRYSGAVVPDLSLEKLYDALVI